MLTIILLAGGLGFIIGVTVMGIINYRAMRKWKREHA